MFCATLARAKAMLSDGPGIGVILDQTLNLEFALEDGLDGHVIPGGQVGRRLDDSLHAIQRAPATYSQPPDGGRVSALLRQHFADSRLDQFQSPFRPLRGTGGELLARDDFRWSGGKQDGGFGSADIDSDQQLVLRRSWGSPVLGRLGVIYLPIDCYDSSGAGSVAAELETILAKSLLGNMLLAGLSKR